MTPSHSLRPNDKSRVSPALVTPRTGCSRAGSSRWRRLTARLVLDENGVRVPMGVFGLGTKHLKRNGRHEEDYHIYRFPQVTFRWSRLRVHRSIARGHMESRRSGTIIFPEQRSHPSAPTSSNDGWNASFGKSLA